MATRILLPLVLLITFGCSFKHDQADDETPEDNTPLQFDRNRIALFSLDSLEDYETPFNKRVFRSASLKQEDLRVIDMLLLEAVENYNSSFANEPPEIDLASNHYRMQLVCVTNLEGEREVWVNCFCSDSDYWERGIVFVNDGGSCFFNLRINLTAAEYTHFQVNGVT